MKKVKFLVNWRTFKEGKTYDLPKSITTGLFRKRPPWIEEVLAEPEVAPVSTDKREIETASITPECEVHEPVKPAPRKRRGRPSKKETVTNG